MFHLALSWCTRRLLRPDTIDELVPGIPVHYDVIEEDALVVVQAIGRKRRNRVLIGGEEIEL